MDCMADVKTYEKFAEVAPLALRKYVPRKKCVYVTIEQ
jgi:hypothetical protein